MHHPDRRFNIQYSLLPILAQDPVDRGTPTDPRVERTTWRVFSLLLYPALVPHSGQNLAPLVQVGSWGCRTSQNLVPAGAVVQPLGQRAKPAPACLAASVACLTTSPKPKTLAMFQLHSLRQMACPQPPTRHHKAGGLSPPASAPFGGLRSFSPAASAPGSRSAAAETAVMRPSRWAPGHPAVSPSAGALPPGSPTALPLPLERSAGWIRSGA